jgi:hypothetical protein
MSNKVNRREALIAMVLSPFAALKARERKAVNHILPTAGSVRGNSPYGQTVAGGRTKAQPKGKN